VTDLEKSAHAIMAQAALDEGKQAATKALGSFLSDDGEARSGKAEPRAAPKSRRNKIIVLGVVALLLLVGLVGLALRFWYWFLLLGLLGVGVLYGRHRWRKRLRSKETKGAAVSGARAKRDASAAAATGALERDAQPGRRIEQAREDRLRDALAQEQAQAREQEEVEDELQALKAKLDK
jgi:hypothetical protein